MNIKLFTLSLVFLTITYTSVAFAFEVRVTADIDRIISNDGSGGRCMAELSVNLQTEYGASFNCPTPVNENSLISFSCNGVNNRTDTAYQMFDMAMMALVMNKQVEVSLDDEDPKHNYYRNEIFIGELCVAKDVAVVK